MTGIPQSVDDRIVTTLRAREVGGGGAVKNIGCARQVLSSLRLTDELVGHKGCVNRLAWDNDDGRLLASVSDDLKIMLWPFGGDEALPGESGVPFVVETLHTQNIFGVGFLPRSQASLIVTGSMDGTVQLHRLERGGVHYVRRAWHQQQGVVEGRASPGTSPGASLGTSLGASPGTLMSSQVSIALPPFPEPMQIGTHTQTFSCHTDRVKDVEVSAHEASLFWSCSEDGTVRQYDIRLRNAEQNDPTSPNVLLHSPNLTGDRGRRSTPFASSYFARYTKYQGINSIRVNPVRPELIAVASQSPHVHIFDRRMCSLGRLPAEPTVSLRTGFSATDHAVPVMQLKYPVRELLRQRAVSADVEVDIRPSYVAWGSKGDKILANYSSGPAVTWSTGLERRFEDDPDDSCHVATRRSGGSSYEVQDPEAVDLYWERYKQNVPFDVERSMADLSRVRTGGCRVNATTGSAVTLRALKKFVATLSWEELAEVEPSELLRDIAQEYSMFVQEDPGRPDLDKSFLWLLFGEYTVRTGPMLASNMLYLIAHPLVTMNFELAGAFIAQMVARRHWPLKLVGEPDAPEGEWMTALEVEEYAESLIKLASTIWVHRHFDSRRKERTIGARYALTFEEIVEGLLHRPETFDRAFWTGDGCREAFGLSLSHVEAGYIEAWISYFARAMSETKTETCLMEALEDAGSKTTSINTPIMLLGSPACRSFEQLYCYHSNENTDIKEAVFFQEDDFVLCASDSGAVAVYDEIGELVCGLESDSTISNCVRPHPRLPIIATSGIEDTIKVWTPFFGTTARVVTEEATLAEWWKNDLERQRISDFGGVSFSLEGEGGIHFAQLLGMLMQRDIEDDMEDDEDDEDDGDAE